MVFFNCAFEDCGLRKVIILPDTTTPPITQANIGHLRTTKSNLIVRVQRISYGEPCGEAKSVELSQLHRQW